VDRDNESSEQDEVEPTFDALRRGYNPDQVNRYLADQQHRLEQATVRAEEAERRLHTAIGQLRAMHGRVTQLETSAQAAVQPTTPIDVLGDRVQRILQEAWDGAFALRQNVDQEVAKIREQAVSDAQAIIEDARTKARSIEEQIRRRRNAFLQRVEQDKSKAVAQMTFLSDQRKAAVAELLDLKERIEAAITDVPMQTAANLTIVNSPVQTMKDIEDEETEERGRPLSTADQQLLAQRMAEHPSGEPPAMRFGDFEQPPTMAVHVIPPLEPPGRPADTSSLVRSHRELSTNMRRRSDRPRRPTEPRVFDIEADDDI